MENRIKIAAVVVTYNRKNLLIECLDSLINQTYPLDAIYIIDNASTDGTPELLIEKGFINKALSPVNEPVEDIKTFTLPAFDKTTEIHYVRMHENTGGAGGFHEGVKRGYEAGYDWLWLMDDDAEPKYDALEILLSSMARAFENTVGLACLVVGNEGLVLKGTRGFYDKPYLQQIPLSDNEIKKDELEIGYASFVGFLVKSAVIKAIGYPLKDFFIWGDDLEYSLRLRTRGKLYLISKSIITHKSNPHKNVKQIADDDSINYWRVIYGQRNLSFINKLYFEESIFSFFRRLIRRVASIIYRRNYALIKCKYLIKAMFLGRKGQLSSDYMTPEKWNTIIKYTKH